jgi:hypothetical protein
MSDLRLYIGRRDSGIRLRADTRYAGMWRVYWPGGEVSPMGNLTRCKDAAVSYARAQMSDWHGVATWDRQKSRPAAPPAAVCRPEVLGAPAEETAV